MRRHDKLKNIHKANILNEVRYLESKGFINEYKILDFKNTIDNDSILQYSFNIGELVYEVSLVQSEGDSRLYTLGFGIEGEDDSAIRTGMNLEHLNTVLYTVDSIVHSAVKSRGMRKIMFEGARDVGDSNIPFIDSLRLKAYLRFLKNKYPKSKLDKDRFGYITVDMKSIYPELFEGKETIFDDFIDLIREISDENPDDWRFEKNYNFNGDRLVGECDTIENSRYGGILIGIDSSKRFKEHSVNIEFFDTDETIDKNFNSFNEIYNFLYNKFIDNNSEEPIDDDDDEPKYDRFTLDEFNLIKNSFNNFGSKMSNMSDSEYNDTKFLTQNGSIEIYRIKNKNGENLKFNFLIYKKNNLYYIKINTFGLKDEPYYYNEESFRNINELVGFINKLNSHY
jgi:hypothetical protein